MIRLVPWPTELPEIGGDGLRDLRLPPLHVEVTAAELVEAARRLRMLLPAFYIAGTMQMVRGAGVHHDWHADRPGDGRLVSFESLIVRPYNRQHEAPQLLAGED